MAVLELGCGSGRDTATLASAGVAIASLRFFDQSDVVRLFAGWRTLLLDERTIDRYERPKVVWEVAVETAAT